MRHSTLTTIVTFLLVVATTHGCKRPVGDNPSAKAVAAEADDLGAPQVPTQRISMPECDGTLHFVLVQDPDRSQTSGRPIAQYFDHAYLGRLAEAYRQGYGIDAQVEPPLPLVASDFDKKRGQYQDERILDRLAERYAGIVADPDAVLIAIMNPDMYAKSIPDWRYAFSMRRSNQGLALVSTFRMVAHPRDGGAARFGHRIRTMVAKDVGRLLCGFRLSDDPDSVMFGDVMGPSDLDGMSEDLRTGRAP